jgi:hypothetical protein
VTLSKLKGIILIHKRLILKGAVAMEDKIKRVYGSVHGKLKSDAKSEFEKYSFDTNEVDWEEEQSFVNSMISKGYKLIDRRFEDYYHRYKVLVFK